LCASLFNNILFPAQAVPRKDHLMNRIIRQLCVCLIFILLPALPVSAEGEVPEVIPPAQPEVEQMAGLEGQGTTFSAEVNTAANIPLSSSLEVNRLAILDPWFTCLDDTVDGVVDGDCQYLSIQAAIDDFTARQGSGIIWIEPGNFNENVTINNIAQLSGLAGDNPFSPVQLSGSLSIQTQIGFSLSSLNILGGVLISNSSGSLAINNVHVSNSTGNGVEIIDHSGDVSLDTVNLSNNTGYGLRIRTTSGSISIRNSTFDNNITGASLLAREYVSIDSSTMNSNSQIGLEILNAASVYISSSNFSYNKGTGVAGAGILASGPITINNVTAAKNTGDGIILFASQGDILIMNSSFNSNGMFGLRAFWPEYYTFSTERVTSCYNRIGSYWLFGSERSGRIETCEDAGSQAGTPLTAVLQMRTIILDSQKDYGTFLTDLPTQVLVLDDQATPPVRLARLLFPYTSNPLAEITVSTLLKDDPRVVPTLETDWLSPGIKVTISSTGDAALQPSLAFSVCFTSASSDPIIAFMADGQETWAALESQSAGGKVCTNSTQPGIFVLISNLP